MHPIRLALVLVPLGLTLQARAGWETVRHDGQDYVTTRSIKSFYGFTTMDKDGDSLNLENAVVQMKVTAGSKEVVINNVKFIFGSEILFHEDRHLVSRVDLSTIIDPVLRPTYIRNSSPFRTVIIDPGHGGSDPGAVNLFGKEKDYALAVARMLKTSLEATGHQVIMTRDDDRTVSRADRIKIANDVANAIFVSIHFKSAEDKRSEGIETIASSSLPAPAASLALATAVHGICLLRTNRFDGGIRRRESSVLAGIKHPAILLIGGYMSNPVESRLIADDKYQQALAKSTTEAITKYRRTTTPHAPRRKVKAP